jgi:hypothetical protein
MHFASGVSLGSALQSASHLTTARRSLESHLMAFAAEDARLGEKVVKMGEFRGEK